MDSVAVSFLVYTLAIMAFGVYSARYSRKTSADFYLANRGLGAWMSALSSSASAESGWVTLGLVGLAYRTGVGALWIIPGTIAAFLFNWYVMADRLRKISAEEGAITIPDILASPFRDITGTIIRIISVLIILSMLTAYVAAQLSGAGAEMSRLFGTSYLVGVIIGVAIVLVYTITGGFRAVVWTDMIQAIVMVAALIVLPIMLLIHLGGPAAAMAKLNAMPNGDALTDPMGGKVGMAMIGFLALYIGIPMGYPGQPHILVRFMATKDWEAVRRGAIIATIWVLFLFAGAVLLGVFAHAAYPDLATVEDTEGLSAAQIADKSKKQTEHALPVAATRLLPGVIAGFMIAAVVAAMCSTADSQLLVSASSVSHDLYVRLLGKKPSEMTIAWINRGAVFLIAGIAFFIAAQKVQVIFDFVLYAWGGLGAGFGPALILRLTWRRTTGWGVIAGMLVGVGTAMVWRATHPITWGVYIYEMIPGLLFSAVAVVLVSLITPGRRGERP